jgi:hypothetical protein
MPQRSGSTKRRGDVGEPVAVDQEGVQQRQRGDVRGQVGQRVAIEVDAAQRGHFTDRGGQLDQPGVGRDQRGHRTVGEVQSPVR